MWGFSALFSSLFPVLSGVAPLSLRGFTLDVTSHASMRLFNFFSGPSFTLLPPRVQELSGCADQDLVFAAEQQSVSTCEQAWPRFVKTCSNLSCVGCRNAIFTKLRGPSCTSCLGHLVCLIADGHFVYFSSTRESWLCCSCATALLCAPDKSWNLSAIHITAPEHCLRVCLIFKRTSLKMYSVRSLWAIQ